MQSFLEIRDPVYGPISLTEDELLIVDSPYVQRLRNIKQTGFAELAFPGATHNRYSHVLGAFHLAGKAFESIFQDFQFKDAAERDRFRAVIRLSALLHDVGHGPLSHAIEQAMPEKKLILGHGTGQASHEDFTEAIIAKSSLTTLINQTFEPEFSTAIVSLIRNENRCPEFFKAAQGNLNLFPILSSLISSEIDVDRMDYLVRDSLYCGIPYGNFDRDWIFSNLTFIQKNQDLYLALDSRALYAFEDFLLSRYHMYLMVYLHHKSVIYDEMLFQFIQTDENQTRLPASVEEYLHVDDYWLKAKLRQSKNAWAQRILQQKPYRMLLELHSDQNEDSRQYADELESQLKRSKIHYFRSSSSGLLSKYAHTEAGQSAPIFVLYRDRRFTSSHSPGVSVEPIADATDLFQRYREKRIIDRIYAETSI